MCLFKKLRRLERWVKGTCCSFRGSRFVSQHPHGSLQLSVSPVPGDPTPSSGPYRKTPACKCPTLFTQSHIHRETISQKPRQTKKHAAVSFTKGNCLEVNKPDDVF